jgi:hypothetical protein
MAGVLEVEVFLASAGSLLVGMDTFVEMVVIELLNHSTLQI